jgi:peptidoglycan/xylan/chitin deacetylase (PgdA/CDA1 family)
VKTRIKTLAKKSLYTAGFCRLHRHLAGPSARRLFILMYHTLTPHNPPTVARIVNDDALMPQQFEAHLRELARHHHVVSLAQAVGEIRSGNGLQSDSVAITFDDGNESVYTIAYPLLKKYGLPATVFLITDWVGNKVLSWWQHLREMIAKVDFSTVTHTDVRNVLQMDIPPIPPTNSLDAVSRSRFCLRLELMLWHMPDEVRGQKLSQLQELFFPRGDFTPNVERILTWAQVREMADNNIEFGSHTKTHINIPFTDSSTVEREIAESKSEIENKIQREVTGFAYPYGRALASYVAVEPILRKHGFTYACNACAGNNSTSSNPYSLCRGSLPLTTSVALINYTLFRGFTRSNENDKMA